MNRKPDIGNVQLYPDRPLTPSDEKGYVLQFFCPIQQKRVRRRCGTRDRREAKKIQRECQDRLANGKYTASNGAITIEQERQTVQASIRFVSEATSRSPSKRSWHECFDVYYRHRKVRSRESTIRDTGSRIEIIGKIIEAKRKQEGLPEEGSIEEFVTLSNLEYVQDRLLEGEEGRFERRAPMTVNSMMATAMAFFAYCVKHKYLSEVPIVDDLPVDEVMKGRPITESEFNKMLEAVPAVVGQRGSASWRFVLQLLWESAFRVSDLMGFSWDDQTTSHPMFAGAGRKFPTILMASSQKNRKLQEIPMLPGLHTMLQGVPNEYRHGWVAKPVLLKGKEKTGERTRPLDVDLKQLARDYGNSAIGRAFGYSDVAVRKWLMEAGIERGANGPKWPTEEVSQDRIKSAIESVDQAYANPQFSVGLRPSVAHVSRIISQIGEQARIVVVEPDKKSGRRIKYASAHDLRRGCASRLFDMGVSTETLRIILRHEDFKTTERHYGARRSAQAAALEIEQKLSQLSQPTKPLDPVHLSQLTEEQMSKLRALLNSI